MPSLVDAEGLFLPSTAALLERGFSLAEVERELSAQIERALRSGLRIDYVDHHMGTAVATPELRETLGPLGTLSAAGAAELAVTAGTMGHAEGDTPHGRMTLQRIDSGGAETILLATLVPLPTPQPGLPPAATSQTSCQLHSGPIAAIT